MTTTLEEIKRNLRIVGQFDLADALDLDSIVTEELRILEYTRYLIALNGRRSHYVSKIRAEIIAAIWGYADKFSEGEHLRVIILICTEKLVRACSDIESIHDKLEILSAAYAASFCQSYDLRKLSQLVGLEDFDAMRCLLPPPDTNAVIDVLGLAYQYHEYGNMDRIAYNKALEKVNLQSFASGEAQYMRPPGSQPEMNTSD